MTIIFVTMLFSSSMPLLYIIAALYFVAAYWAEKFELLTIAKRPIAYSDDLAMYVTETLPFAVSEGG